MTKDNKFQEKPKIKVLEKVEKADVALMYSAVTTATPGKPMSIQDWKKVEGLYNAITKEATEVENGLTFRDVDALVLTISQHNDLIKKMEAPIFSNLESAKKANEIVERLNELEAVESDLGVDNDAGKQ